MKHDVAVLVGVTEHGHLKFGCDVIVQGQARAVGKAVAVGVEAELAHKIRGKIVADKSMKDDKTYGEGWCWDDDNPVLSPLVFARKDGFMDRFVDRLKDAGIVLEADTPQVKRCPESAFSVCTRFHTMDQIMHKMMKESDNLYAESMYYQIAASTGNRPASAKSARSVERQLLRKLEGDDACQRARLSPHVAACRSATHSLPQRAVDAGNGQRGTKMRINVLVAISITQELTFLFGTEIIVEGCAHCCASRNF